MEETTEQVEVTVEVETTPAEEVPAEETPATPAEQPQTVEILLGELKAKVEQLELDKTSQAELIQNLQQELKWAEDSDESLREVVFRMMEELETMKAQPTENDDSTENESENNEQEQEPTIPAIPEVVEQEEPQAAKSSRPWWF